MQRGLYLEKMEVCEDPSSDNLKKNRPLTPVRILRGLMILLVFLSTAFMFLIYFAPIFALALRLLSVHQSRKAISFLFGHWLALWPYLFETVNGTTVLFYGDSVPAEKRVLLIANHRTEVDWMYLWNIALRKGCLGYIKYVLKSSLMRLPIFGWGFHILEFIPVERKREVDEPVMLQMLSTFKDPQEPLWLALFPEGTDFTYYMLFPLKCVFALGLFLFHIFSETSALFFRYMQRREMQEKPRVCS